jgi:hypothetical protein
MVAPGSRTECRLSSLMRRLRRFNNFTPNVSSLAKPSISVEAERVGSASPDVSLFGDLKRVVDLDAEVSDSAFDLCMSQQKLDRT